MNGTPTLPLRDIHLPPEPAWWPPAPGWWFVAVLTLVALAVLTRAVLRQVRRRRGRRVLLDELRAIDQGTPAQRLAALSLFLRRLCKRDAPAALGLQGDDWLRFWDGRDRACPFSVGPGRLLLDGPFRPDADAAAVDAVFALVRRRLARWPA